MRSLLVLTFAALAYAEPGYLPPSGSYGAPSAGGGGYSSGGYSSGGHGGGFGGGSGFGGGLGGGFASGYSGAIGGGYASDGGYASGYAGGYSGGYDTGYSGTPTVHKHIYVHVPPPETEIAPAPRIIAPQGPPRKHYKIVFIKAPTPPTPTAPIIPVVPQDQEKTLIYVLVKRPEEGQPIVIPTPAPTQPTKPEVYFIRYRTQKETQSVGGGYPSGPAPAPTYGVPSGSGGHY